MYFDAVLDVELQPIFNGAPDDTRKWLAEPHNRRRAILKTWRVCVGETMELISSETYLARK